MKHHIKPAVIIAAISVIVLPFHKRVIQRINKTKTVAKKTAIQKVIVLPFQSVRSCDCSSTESVPASTATACLHGYLRDGQSQDHRKNMDPPASSLVCIDT